MPSLSSRLSPPRMYVGSQASPWGVLGRLARLIPTQRAISHGRSPPPGP